MGKVLSFQAFLSESYLAVELLENEKSVGDIVISDQEGDEEFSQKPGVPYIRIKDNSVEFTKSTPVDTATLALNGTGEKKPGVLFLQSKLPNPPVEKKFFSPDQTEKNAYDILLQIYTLFYKESLQDVDEKLLSNLTNAVFQAEKTLGNKISKNPSFSNLVKGLKDVEKADSGMKEHSKYLDQKAKDKIIGTISSVIQSLF